MNYETALKKYKESKTKFLNAERELTLLKSNLQKARETTPKLHDKLTTVMAELEVGESNKKDLSDAQSEYENACNNLDELKTKVTAKEKAVPLFRDKMQNAKAEFMKLAYPHYQQKSIPVIEAFIKAFDALDKAKKAQDKLISEMNTNDVDYSNHLPGEVLKFEMKLNHIRREHTPEKWLSIARERNELFNQQLKQQ